MRGYGSDPNYGWLTRGCRTRSREAAAAVINATWPGGLHALLADYVAGRCAVPAVATRTNLTLKAVRDVLRAHGIEPRKGETCAEWLHDASPERQALYLAEPVRNANAIAPMTRWEKAFADVLAAADLQYEFNQQAATYWLDFFVRTVGLGFEVHNTTRSGCRVRDVAIREKLGLRAILYIPDNLLQSKHLPHVAGLVAAIRRDGDDLAASLGDSRHLRLRPLHEHVNWRGYRFQNEWLLTLTRFEATIERRMGRIATPAHDRVSDQPGLWDTPS